MGSIDHQVAATLEKLNRAAVVVSSHNSAPQQQQQAALEYQQATTGPVAVALLAGVALVKGGNDLQAQLMGYNLLGHLVEQRWQELSSDQQMLSTMDEAAYAAFHKVLQMDPAPKPLKSKSANLLGSLLSQHGASTLSNGQLLDSILQLSVKGNVQGECVCYFITALSDAIIGARSDVRGSEWKRGMLSLLNIKMPDIVSCVLGVLERSLPDTDSPSYHATIASLSTLIEWAPLTVLNQSAFVQATHALYNVSSQAAESACQLVKMVCQRKATREDKAEHKSLISKLANMLGEISSRIDLSQGFSDSVVCNGVSGVNAWAADEEVLLMFVQTLVHFGLCVQDSLDGEPRMKLLQQILRFTKHPHLPISAVPLDYWVQLLRKDQDNATRAYQQQRIPLSPGGGPATYQSTSSSYGDSGVSYVVPESIRPEVMQAITSMLTRLTYEMHWHPSEPPASFNSPLEYKEHCDRCRAQSKALLRSCAVIQPIQALTYTHHCLNQIPHFVNQSPPQPPPGVPQNTVQPPTPGSIEFTVMSVLVQGVVQGVQELLNCVPPSTGGVGDTQAAATKEITSCMVDVVRVVMSQTHTNAQVILLQHKTLLAACKTMNIPVSLKADILNYLFQRLATFNASGITPPGPLPVRPTPQQRDEAQSRHKLCQLVDVVVSNCDEGLTKSEVWQVARSVNTLRRQGVLLWGERSTLLEGVLAATAKADVDMHREALSWVLDPIKEEVSTQAWQAQFLSPSAFIYAFLPRDDSLAAYSMQTPAIGGRTPRWQLYHHIALITRCCKISQKYAHMPLAADTTSAHPLQGHISWILGYFCRLLWCVHASYSDEVRAGPLAGLEGVLTMAEQEKAPFQLRPHPAVAHRTQDDDDLHDVSGVTVQSGRTFLRTCREHVYIGIAEIVKAAPQLLKQADSMSCISKAAQSGLAYMKPRHFKILIRHVMLTCLQVALQGDVLAPREPLPAGVCDLLLQIISEGLSVVQREWAVASGVGGEGGIGNGHMGNGDMGNGVGQEDSEREEVVRDGVMRQTTRELLSLLRALLEVRQARTSRDGAKTIGGREARPIPAPQNGYMANAANPCFLQLMLDAPQGDSVARGIALATLTCSVEALTWPDSETIRRCALVCRFFVSTSAQQARTHRMAPGVQEAVTQTVLEAMYPAAVRSLKMPATQSITSDVIALIRAIVEAHWREPQGRLRQSSVQLLQCDAASLASFENKFFSSSSEKDQKSIVKNFIMQYLKDK